MANKVGELVWQVEADTKSFDKNMKSTEKTTQSFGKKLAGLAAKGGPIAAVAAAVIAVGVGAVKMGKTLIDAASKAEETGNKFDVTFSDISDRASETAEDLADSFGLSQQASEDLLAGTGDLLAGFGFTQDAALDLSDQVNTLAGDLSSFQNVDIKDASDAITKALLGEREALKSLGIAITEADINQLAKDKGITGALDRQTKAALTFELAMSQSGNAVGDFARSADSYENRMRVAAGATQDLTAELGKALLPAASEAVGIFGTLTRKLADYVKAGNDAKDIIDIAFGDKEGSLAEKEATFQSIVQDLADVNKELEGMNESNMAAYAIERSLKREYEAALADLAERIDKEKALEAQQKKNLRLDEEKAAAIKAAADAETGAKERLAEIEESRLSDSERQIYLLQEEIDQWAQFRDVPGVQELINELITERNAIIAESNLGLGEQAGIMGELGTTSSMYYDNAVNRSEELAEVQDAEAGRIQELEDRYKSLASSGIGVVTDSISAMAEALVLQEDGWDAFAKAGLLSIAAILDGFAAELTAMAAVATAASIMGKVTDLPAIPVSLGGAVAASAASGLLRGLAGSFEQGGIIPEVPGVPATGDNMLARVNPGEQIIPADEAGGELQIVINLDGEVIANTVIDDYVNKGRVIVDSSRGVR